MRPEFIERMSAPVPRYTSYPTAPHFSAAVGAAQFADSLSHLRASARLSLYVHIPFCASLCWYCGCNTKAVRSREPVAEYLPFLEREMATVGGHLSGSRGVSDIHWGGGSPNILSADQIRQVAEALRRNFQISPSAEFAVEIDPRWLDPDQVAAFAAAGVTRASIGVQDFDPTVQRAINREQPLEVTRKAIEALRAAGIKAINIDLIYGPPHQTRDSIARTIEQVISLAPDRIALFGYAHLPSRAKHQSMIDETALPGSIERFGQSQRARRLLTAAGYVAVGIDHFARPGDTLAAGSVKRNFQGYTTGAGDALIGFGASAISSLPDGYFQNAASRQEYMRRIELSGLATVRGILLKDEDRARAYVIERLMCDFEFSQSDVLRRFGPVAEPIICEAEELLRADQDGLVEKTADGFRLTALGRPFVRSVAACFDSYYDCGPSRYSAGV